MVGLDALPTYKKVVAWFLGPVEDTGRYLQRFRRLNRGLDMDNWRVYERKEEPVGVGLVLSIDSTSIMALENLGWRPFSGVGRADFSLLGVKPLFIPKPVRNSYSGPKDYRPTSLTSFLHKTMERLVDRYLRDEALALVPLHPNQHAYQAGKSVETALHQLILRVENVLDQQETALGVFLDIEGAFRSTCYDTMCDALGRHGSDYTLVRCIRAILEGRVAVSKLGGFSLRLAISRGCPQGVELSPLLW
jgi:hypothetical protein